MKEGDHLVDLGMEEEVILTFIFNKYALMIRT